MFRILLISAFAAVRVHADYTVRIVTISPLELTAVRASLRSGPSDGDGLRNELLSHFAAPACDMILRCGEGRAKAEAVVETPYPTEFDPPAKAGGITMSSAFATRNVGYTAEVEITSPADGTAPRMAISWLRVLDRGFEKIPSTTSASDSGSIIQPLFAANQINATLTIDSGHWHLLGITRPRFAANYPFATDPPEALLTFVQVTASPPPQAAHAGPPDSRLHLLTFTVPTAECFNLALRPSGGDTALLDHFLERTGKGEIALAGHEACLVPFRREVRPPPPLPAPRRPVCRTALTASPLLSNTDRSRLYFRAALCDGIRSRSQSVQCKEYGTQMYPHGSGR